jgi:hypothetical protein
MSPSPPTPRSTTVTAPFAYLIRVRATEIPVPGNQTDLPRSARFTSMTRNSSAAPST